MILTLPADHSMIGGGSSLILYVLLAVGSCVWWANRKISDKDLRTRMNDLGISNWSMCVYLTNLS